MPPVRREWKKSQKSREDFNDEIYLLLDEALRPYKTDPVHVRYNDARLVTREILDNIYKHNDPAFIIGLVLEVDGRNMFQIQIYHDGDEFDPFLPANDCRLLIALDYEYQFKSKFVLTDAGRHRLNLRFDLSSIVDGETQ